MQTGRDTLHASREDTDMQRDEKVRCDNPEPGKKPVRIARWKYEAVRQAMVGVLSMDRDGVPFRDLAARVRSRLEPHELERLGSVSWYTTVVKLDLEAKGRVRRVPGSRPQVVQLIGRPR